jgi:hypothetical protein
VLTNSGRNDGGDSQNCYQGDADDGLHEGEGAPAHIIMDLHTKHGEACNPSDTTEGSENCNDNDREN